MPFCRFAEGAGMYDVTPIENMFLVDYLPIAPEGFVRVYLYVRMLALHPEMGEGLADVAQALRMDEEAVFNAMSYWERQGLVCRMSDNPPTYQLRSVQGAAASSEEECYYEYRNFNASLQSLFGADRLLQPKQYAEANDWLNILGFTQEAVLYLLEKQVKKSRSKSPDPAYVFKKVNETALRLADRGARTRDDVERALLYEGRVAETAEAVSARLALNRPATLDELSLVKKWLDEWSFTHDEILAACEKTTSAQRPNFKYLNTILEKSRTGAGVVHELLEALGSFRKQPTEDELTRYEKLLKQGFAPETIRLAAIQCSQKGKSLFADLEQMLVDWHARGLTRYDDAAAFVQKNSLLRDEVAELLKKCGSERRIQMADIELYETWKADHPELLIDCAVELAVRKPNPMNYIDKVLADWKQAGVKTPDEAKARQATRAARNPGAAPANPALNYEQRTYQEDDYEKMYTDLDSLLNEGGDAK